MIIMCPIDNLLGMLQVDVSPVLVRECLVKFWCCSEYFFVIWRSSVQFIVLAVFAGCFEDDGHQRQQEFYAIF